MTKTDCLLLFRDEISYRSKFPSVERPLRDQWLLKYATKMFEKGTIPENTVDSVSMKHHLELESKSGGFCPRHLSIL